MAQLLSPGVPQHRVVWRGEGKPAKGSEVSVLGQKRREVPVQPEVKGGFH